MRFKKLKILLGITLIIFILFVGNVLVFGKLLNEIKTEKNEKPLDLMKDYQNNITILKENNTIVNKTETNTNINKTNVDTNKTTVKNTTQPVEKTPAPVVIVTKKKTRAS